MYCHIHLDFYFNGRVGSALLVVIVIRLYGNTFLMFVCVSRSEASDRCDINSFTIFMSLCYMLMTYPTYSLWDQYSIPSTIPLLSHDESCPTN